MLCNLSPWLGIYIAVGIVGACRPQQAQAQQKPASPSLKLVAGTVKVPEGVYSVGCDGEGICQGNRLRQVTLPAYTIDRYPVVEVDYERCETSGTCPQHYHFSIDGESPDQAEIAIVAISAAEMYCSWKQGHLTTDAEWEVAGRGRSGRLYPWGDDWSDDKRAKKITVRRGDIVTTYARAGTRPDLMSEFGVEDMAGTAPQFVRASAGIQVRGAPSLTARRKARPYDYSLVALQFARDSELAAFRCAYP